MDKAFLKAIENSMSDSEFNQYRKRLKVDEGVPFVGGLGLRREELPPPREPLDLDLDEDEN